MPDVFDISSMTDAIQGYLDAKKQRNVFEMEKKQREAEILLNTMQEKRLRETMLQTGKFQQEELGQRGQQFQQTLGFEKERQKFYETQTSAINKMQLDIDEIKRGYLAGVTPSAITAEQKENVLREKLADFKMSPEEFDLYIKERAAKVAQAEEAVKTIPVVGEAERGEAQLKIDTAAKQKEAIFAKANRDIAEANADAEYMRTTGKTEWISRAEAHVKELELQKERITLAKTDQEIARAELDYKKMQLKYLQDNPPVSPERQFKLEEDKMKLGVQIDLLTLLSRVKESDAPVGVTTELMSTQRQQAYYMSERMEPGIVDPMTNGAIGLGASYGITVTYKTVEHKGKTYTIIDTFYKNGKPILPGQEGAPGTPTNPEIPKDDKNFDALIRKLIDDIEKRITPEETGRTSIIQPPLTTTTTQPPPLVTNEDTEIAQAIIDAAKAAGDDPLQAIEQSSATKEIKEAGRKLLMPGPATTSKFPQGRNFIKERIEKQEAGVTTTGTLPPYRIIIKGRSSEWHLASALMNDEITARDAIGQYSFDKQLLITELQGMKKIVQTDATRTSNINNALKELGIALK